MLLNDYQTQARTTATYRTPFMYPALGLAGETGKLIDKTEDGSSHGAIQGELGDVLWYVSNVAWDAGLTLTDVVGCDPSSAFAAMAALPTPDDWVKDLAVAVGKVCEVVKKTDRDDAGVLTEERQEKVKLALRSVLFLLQDMTIECDTTLTDVAKANLDKLASRKERGVLKGDGDNR